MGYVLDVLVLMLHSKPRPNNVESKQNEMPTCKGLIDSIFLSQNSKGTIKYTITRA